MAGSATASHPQKKSQAIVSAKSLACRPDSHLHPGRPVQFRRRIRKRSVSLSGVVRRTDGSITRGRRSGPGTPLLRWKFEDDDRSCKSSPETGGNRIPKARSAREMAKASISSRKIAAGIWHLQLREVTRSGGTGREAPGASPGFGHVDGNLQSAHACNENNANLHFRLKNGFSSSIALRKFASPVLPNHVMERATKWDAGCPKTSEEVLEIFSQLKLLEGQQVSTTSIISSLQAELEWARSRICELEAERRSVNKKLDHFLRKLAEEKASWRCREHEKVRAILDSMKVDLRRERKNRHRCEIVNSKLVNELAEAKLSVKRLLQDYEKERKARALIEEVCNELAKEIGEDKAEVESLKRDSMKIREEVEEERKMLQMAEVWREERVQMKLLDAKLALEDEYAKLNRLQTELEAFLIVQNGTSPDQAHIRQAELLKEAIDLAKVNEIKEFTYQPPPASEDIFAVFEELRPKEETNERDIEPCYGYSRLSHESNIHSVSPATDVFLEKPTRRYSNRDTDEESDWETLSPDEEQESSNSPGGSEPSVNARCGKGNSSVSRTNSRRKEDNCEVIGESSEIYSPVSRQPKKGAYMARLWRSSCPNNGEILKKNFQNGRLSNGRMSNAALSPDCRFGEVVVSPPRVDQWCSPNSVNAHIARGMKGCIEWPRASLKHSLKAKLLEARMESHKTQLRHVLRQKI